jgi:L-lactate dehydrogenase complex protein LldG
MSSDKENMLTSIRAALGRGTLAAAPVYPLAPPAQTTDACEDVSERFCTELRRVGGHATIIRSDEELKEYLRNLLPEGGETVVASSIGGRVGVWIDGLSASVISTAGEAVPVGLGNHTQASTFKDERERLASEDSSTRSLLGAEIGITSADYGIAETGTLVLVTGRERRRLVSLLPAVHVCLLDVRRVVGTMSQLLARVHADFYAGDLPPQSLTMITGPSCTADIEQTLTQGMHGPRELHVLLHTGLF